MTAKYDGVVVGSGPNGLAAAITLAQAGCSVVIYEASKTAGGGARTQELISEGCLHDVCSAVHPLAKISPVFSSFELDKYGLEWIFPEFPLAHPLDGKPGAVLKHSLEETARGLGKDGEQYQNLLKPFVENIDALLSDLLGPFSLPRHPFLTSRFAYYGFQPATRLARTKLSSEAVAALFGGLCCHSLMSLDRPLTSAFGLVLAAVGHAVGWPIPKGGARSITDALVARLLELGGELKLGAHVSSLSELPESKITLLDVTPRQVLDIAGKDLESNYKKSLSKFRYGNGVFKMDFILSQPTPFTDKAAKKAGTVHLGGSFAEMLEGERMIDRGAHPEKPFVLFSQPTSFDDSRAPQDKHIVWAYCHVPNASTVDMSERIIGQIERFAPGFRDCIVGQHSMNCEDLQSYNENYIGGDINGGVQDIWQFMTRPTKLFAPYATSKKGLYLCSSSTPPGGGVHGMCGYHAAKLALKREMGIR